MSYFTDLKISTNEVAGFVAEVLVEDLKTNNFMFEGFPSISVEHDHAFFHVFLAHNDKKVRPYSLPHKEAIKKVNAFRKSTPVELADLKAIQAWIAQLESK